MNWQYPLAFGEYSFICLFIGFYIAYVIKIIFTARQLHAALQPIIGKLMLRSFYFSLLIVALLGPSFGGVKKEIKALGKDIYLLVDLSQSMNATDIAPSRLERIKYELRNLVTALQPNRLGLIVFSSEAFIQCPLTVDQNTLLLFIETLKTTLVPGGGTNFEPALQLALDKHTDITNTTSTNQAKLIILFSDGENFGDNVTRLASEINNRGIRLFTVGVGSFAGGKIPVGKGYMRNKENEEIISMLQSKELRLIADQNGDNYFEISDKQNDIPKLVNTIKSIEGQMLDKRKTDVADNKYYYFLLAALLLIMLDILITTKTIHL